MSLPDHRTVLVRVAPEIVAKLEREGSGPVHVLGIERRDDGTADLTLRTPGPEPEIERLRALIVQARDLVAEAYSDDEDNDSPGNMAFAVLNAALAVAVDEGSR